MMYRYVSKYKRGFVYVYMCIHTLCSHVHPITDYAFVFRTALDQVSIKSIYAAHDSTTSPPAILLLKPLPPTPMTLLLCPRMKMLV